MNLKDFLKYNKLNFSEKNVQKYLEKNKIGILITNIGTPSKPTYFSLFKYLSQFLSDKRVVKLNKFFWIPILYGIILPFRSGISASKYKKIWTENGSPLNVYTNKQCLALKEILLKKYGSKITISYGMRYGDKSIKSGLDYLKKENINKLLILPLYPQMAECTTISTFDCISYNLKNWIDFPSIRFISNYCLDENYIDALKETIEIFWKKNGKSDKIIFSYHSLPLKTVIEGDKYPFYCIECTNKISNKLNLKKEEYYVAFQSNIKGQLWLKPSIEDLVISLAKKGFNKVDVICPSFSVDCLETLEELIYYGDLFKKYGNGKLRYINCLNDSQIGINFLLKLIEQNIAGWL